MSISLHPWKWLRLEHFYESLQKSCRILKKKLCSDTVNIGKITDNSLRYFFFLLKGGEVGLSFNLKSSYMYILVHYTITFFSVNASRCTRSNKSGVLLMRRRNVTRSTRLLWAKVWRGSDMGFVFVGRGGRRAARTPSLSLYYLFSRRSCRLNGSWGVAYKPPTSACFAFHSSCQINRFLLWQIVSGW